MASMKPSLSIESKTVWYMDRLIASYPSVVDRWQPMWIKVRMGTPIFGIVPALFYYSYLLYHSLRDINIQTPCQLDSVDQNIRQLFCYVSPSLWHIPCD